MLIAAKGKSTIAVFFRLPLLVLSGEGCIIGSETLPVLLVKLMSTGLGRTDLIPEFSSPLRWCNRSSSERRGKCEHTDVICQCRLFDFLVAIPCEEWIP